MSVKLGLALCSFILYCVLNYWREHTVVSGTIDRGRLKNWRMPMVLWFFSFLLCEQNKLLSCLICSWQTGIMAKYGLVKKEGRGKVPEVVRLGVYKVLLGDVYWPTWVQSAFNKGHKMQLYNVYHRLVNCDGRSFTTQWRSKPHTTQHWTIFHGFLSRKDELSVDFVFRNTNPNDQIVALITSDGVERT